MQEYKLPKIIYGTAWKEDLTQECVAQALRAGFRAIDTANQRKHYYEQGVGLGIAEASKELALSRQDLFLQTKFTFAGGQDHRKPYAEEAEYAVQVMQSFESSLEHLQTDYLDSYLLHGPSTGVGLVTGDLEVWTAMEELFLAKKTKSIGVSNFRLEQLVELYDKARIKPSFVQNRCFAETQWDFAIREYCRQKGIHYQGFSLLTANWQFLGGEVLRPVGRNIPHLVFPGETLGENLGVKKGSAFERLAALEGKYNKGIQQIIFKFTEQMGMIPITGTRSIQHMQMDLQINDFNLTDEELRFIERIAFGGKANLPH